jgi:acyl-CoA thioesterase FadM
MYPFLRLGIELALARRAGPLPIDGVHHSRHTCWPWDLDPWVELNNGRTLTLYDLGRVPLAVRCGLVAALRARGWGLTVAGASVRFRRRVRAFDRIEMRSAFVGRDARFLYVQQAMFRGGDALSGLLIRAAVTGPGGIVPTDEVMAAIGDALADTELTVDELTKAIVDRTGPWAGEQTMEAFGGRWPRWRQLTSTAAHRGMLCFGPDQGRKVTYTNPHRWLPGFQPQDGEAALRTLVMRYLYAYGPARPQHFARWLAIPPQRAVELFDELADDLEQVELDGAPGWVMAGDTGTPSQPHRGIRLLGYFDAFVVAGQPRERLYPGAAATRALSPAGQAGNYPVLLVDGVVAGVWHQRRSGRKLAITVEPLGELTATQHRQLEDEVELVSAVMKAKATLTLGTVTVGPHA